MACDEFSCWKDIAKVRKYDTDVTLIEVKRLKKKWFVDEPAPGETDKVVAVDLLDRFLRGVLRETVGGAQGFVIREQDDCPAGECQCKYGEGDGEQTETQTEHTIDAMRLDYVVEEVLDSPNWDAAPLIVTGEDGATTTINPIVDQLEPVSPDSENSYRRMTRYTAHVSFKVKADVYHKVGACQDVPETPHYVRDTSRHARDDAPSRPA